MLYIISFPNTNPSVSSKIKGLEVWLSGGALDWIKSFQSQQIIIVILFSSNLFKILHMQINQ
jgi:hypothetical protein